MAGVVQVFTPGSSGWGIDRVLDGLGTVIFGLVLLGNTTGYISWSVWWVVVTLWPALVIALGLTILAKGLGQSWLRIVATLVIWVTLAYAVAVSWTGSTMAPPTGWLTTAGGQEFAYSEPGVGVDEGRPAAERRSRARFGSAAGGELVTVEGVLTVRAAELLGEASGDSAQVEDRLARNPPARVVIVPGASVHASTPGCPTARCGTYRSRRARRPWTRTCPTSECATWS